jgi:tetratricopeptide (TPR) repeat protein
MLARMACLLVSLLWVPLALGYSPPEDAREVLVVSPEMRTYFLQYVDPSASLYERTTTIVDAVLDQDKFNFQYDWEGVYHPQEVFRTHKGNCISFSLLVGALCKEFGVEATFQHVYLFRTKWTTIGDCVAEVGHINLTIEDYGRIYTIDFSRILGGEQVSQQQHPMTENAAVALFYSNYGIHAYARKDPEGMKWLHKAVEVDSNYLTNSNLGTAYLYEHRDLDALQYLELARKFRRDARIYALLASAERRLGNVELAVQYEKKARRYLDSNPFYHFSLAKDLFNQGEYSKAEERVDQALRLRTELSFLELKVEILMKLGKDSSSVQRKITKLREAEPPP